MPTYIFLCDPDLNGCGASFEKQVSMSEVANLRPTCSSCKKRKPVRRDYLAERPVVFDATPKTVGTLAARNSSKKSADELESIRRKNTAYKNKPLEVPLGPGMTQVERDSQGQVKVSQSQSKIDKRRKRHD